jgi:hypothetical protein
MVPFRCTQARPFNGNVSGRIDGMIKKEVVEVEDGDRFTRTIRLDNTFSTASWTIDFDRDTYALFTDCVIRIEDPETGNAIRNSGFSQRSTSVSLSVPKNQAEPKAYKLVLQPAFSLEKDHKKWRFTLTEKLAWRTGALALEPVRPKQGNFKLLPFSWKDLEFRLPGTLPAASEGYKLNCTLEAKSAGKDGVILQKSFEL